jgi:hypothetical protein
VEWVIGWLNELFGRGTDDYPFWLATVRINILLFVACAVGCTAWHAWPSRARRARVGKVDLGIALAFTALAGLLRFAVQHNLSDLGGIGYSRILFGYQGHFGAAQLFSLVYARTARDLETAIVLNRIAATMTVPLVYALCRRLVPAARAFAMITAALVAFHPLSLLFSATDCLPISTSLLAAASYLLLAQSIEDGDARRWVGAAAMGGAASGLTLLTQVRYENVLFLVPAGVYLWANRRRVRPDLLVAGGTLFALFIAIYATEALRSDSSYRNPIRVAAGLRLAAREVFPNPILALAPVLVGTTAAMFDRRSRVRLLAPLPLLIAVVLSAVTNTEAHNQARTYLNEVLLVSLVAGYGLALMWESRWRIARVAAAGSVLWTLALPILFWPNLRERYLETVEHDFLRAAFASLPAGIERVIVPDDDRLNRETHSTIELATKYRLIASAAGAGGVDLVGMTRFLEHPGEFDCSRDKCALFRGVPCMELAQYWFALPECTQLMATRTGEPLREEEVVAGSFLDCSIYRGEARARICDPVRTSQRLGLYRLAP